MPSSPLSAEEKPSLDDAPASGEMPADYTLSVVKDSLAEEKASPEMTPHLEVMPSLDEKPLKEGEPKIVAKLSAAAAVAELTEGVTPSAAVAKELPERVTPSAAVAKELPEGVTPLGEEPSAVETKLFKTSCANLSARIGRPSYFLGMPYPKGAVLFMVLVSLIYVLITPWLLRCVAGKPRALVWTASHLANSYFFIGTICLSRMRFYTVFFRISYGELLSVAAVHFIGTDSGATIATLLTFYAAGMFGHAIAEYVQREETEESIKVVVIPSQVKPNKESLCHFLFMHGVLSFLVILRLISLVVYPASVLLFVAIKDNMKIPVSVVDEISVEIIFLAWPWSGFMGLILQEEVAILVPTMIYRIPACVVLFYTLSCVLSCALGEVAAMLTLWPVAMAMAGLFGYILSMFARYEKVLKSLSRDGYYDQKAMVQKVPDEPNQKVEPIL